MDCYQTKCQTKHLTFLQSLVSSFVQLDNASCTYIDYIILLFQACFLLWYSTTYVHNWVSFVQKYKMVLLSL